MRNAVLLAACLAACSRPSSERVYVSDEDGGAIVVLDARSDEVVARIEVGKRPRGLVVSPDGKWLYVALSGSPKAPPGVDPETLPPADRSADGIGVVDLGALKLVRVIAGGRDPETFDVSRDGKRLWVSNEETAEASLVDLEAGTVIRRAPVGVEPEGVTIHPSGAVVYVTNEEDGTISVLDAESGATRATIPACRRPRAVAFTPDGALGFASCENEAAIAVLDGAKHERRALLKLPSESTRPMDLEMSRDGGTLWVSGGRGRDVHEIDVARQAVRRTIADVGVRPWGVALARDGKKLYTANGPSGDVSVIDAATGEVLRRVDVGGSPWGIAVR